MENDDTIEISWHAYAVETMALKFKIVVSDGKVETIFETPTFNVVETCNHEFIEATCETPKTCTKCGETEGVALGHIWKEATSQTPKTCTRCGVTEGDPLPEVESIEANYTKEEIYIGETLQLIPIVNPVGAIQDVTYSLKLEDGALATIDENGLFEALHEGKVYITIRSVDNTYVACVVEVFILHPLIEDGGYDVFT